MKYRNTVIANNEGIETKLLSNTEIQIPVNTEMQTFFIIWTSKKHILAVLLFAPD